MNDELNNYIERSRNWQNKAISHLTFTNNFILTLSVALLAFIFNKDQLSAFYINLNDSINYHLIFYLISFFSLVLSILTGIIVIISRLFDFRISRHIALTRLRYYRKFKKTLSHDDFPYPSLTEIIQIIFKVLFKEINLLTQNETEYLNVDISYMKKFNSLREFSYKLGSITWIFTKYQLKLFFISCLLYFISFFN